MNEQVSCLTDEHCRYIIGYIGSSTGCIAEDSELLHLLVQDLLLTKSCHQKEYKRYREVIDSLDHDVALEF